MSAATTGADRGNCVGGADWADRLARVALNAVTEPGDPRIAKLVSELGAIQLHHRLAEDRGMAAIWEDAGSRAQDSNPELIVERATRSGVRFVVPGDHEWPGGLADLDLIEPVNRLGGMPLGLWVKGPLRLDELGGSVAVVGSRSATTYGTEVAARFAAELVERGRVVVSGAAFGIDYAAHRGALANRGQTVAVLACGVDRAYPAAHGQLLGRLAAEHAVVSELRPGCSPTRVRFLGRNRLIAALTSGVVVVEAAARSGALNTANWATRLNRVLLGVPGPITSAPSVGVHELVRSGAAQLVTSAAQVVEATAPIGAQLAPPPRGTVRRLDELSDLAQRVHDALPVRKVVTAASVARTAGISVERTVGALEELVRLGLAEAGLAGEGTPGWRVRPEQR